jgi:hypothetical protein
LVNLTINLFYLQTQNVPYIKLKINYMLKKVPFFEYPRLWSDNKEDYISIFDQVSSTGGFILQKALSDFEIRL